MILNRSRRAVWSALLVALTAMPLAAQDIEVNVPPTASVEDERVEQFTFTDQTGQTVTRDDLLGKPWLACFIFTRCASTCPKVTAAMAKLTHELEETDVQFISITVDPARDTTEVLKHYAEQFRADPQRWRFVRGDKRATFHLIHHSFGMPAAENPKGPPGFEVIHSNNIMHVDASGQVVGKYNALVDDDMVALRRVIRQGLDTPEKYVFVKPDMGIHRDTERDDLATTSPPDQKAKDAPVPPPEWVLRLPALNASLNGLATLLLLAGFVLVKAGKVNAHRNTMLAAFGVSTAFLASYLVYHSFQFTKSFEQTGPIRHVYLAILTSHIILAVFVPGLAGITIYRGLKGQVERHRRIAKITFPIWLYVSVTGVIIYLMLYRWPM